MFSSRASFRAPALGEFDVLLVCYVRLRARGPLSKSTWASEDPDPVCFEPDPLEPFALDDPRAKPCSWLASAGRSRANTWGGLVRKKRYGVLGSNKSLRNGLGMK